MRFPHSVTAALCAASFSVATISSVVAQQLLDPSVDVNDIGGERHAVLSYDSQSGRSYFMEGSADLVNWEFLPSINLGSGSEQSFLKSVGGDRSHFFRLYRADQITNDPDNADFDNDGIKNIDEIKIGGSKTNPFKFSTADSSLSDYFFDSDGNGLFDGWELTLGSRVGLLEANGDNDADGLVNSDEFMARTNPYNSDTDGDGLSDGDEVNQSTSPLVNQFSEEPDTIGLKLNSQVDTLSELRAAWDFRRSSSSLFFTSTANFFHAERSGSVVGSSTFTGPVSHTATFNGVAYLRTPYTVNSNTGDGTVAFWFKSDPSSSARAIFSRDSGKYPLHFAFYSIANAVIFTNGVPRVEQVGRFWFRSGVPYSFNSGGTMDCHLINPDLLRIDDGQWHHIVFSIDGRDTQITIDGVNEAQPMVNLFDFFDEPTIVGAPSNLDQSSSFYIGTHNSFFAGLLTHDSLNAEIAQVLIYDRALSDTDAEALYNYDADGDGVTNIEEFDGGSDPHKHQLDIDNDGLTNEEERAGVAVFDGSSVSFGATNIFNVDTDGDLFDDYWEARYFSSTIDPNNASKPNPNADSDNDGLTNFQEFINGTNPNKFDSDDDSVGDGAEVDFGSDPNDVASQPLDPSDFFGNENLDSFHPIGALDVMLKAGSGEGSNSVVAQVGDESSSHSERWRLKIGGKSLTAPTFGELSDRTLLALDPTENHRITLEHVGTDPSLNLNEPDYDYTAIIETVDGSPFLLCDPDELLADSASNIDIDEVSQQEAYLIPLDGYSFSESYSGGDAVGPRYRKVSLNGRPQLDEKPQQEEESDLPDEQTYIDAFNLSLHHDNSLCYLPLAASDLILQASMSSTETGFSDRSGLRPHERFDLPFGAGWSSNLCSYVEVVETIGNEVTVDPITVNVIDEAGRQQRFGTNDFNGFFPWPSARVDKKTYLNELSRSGDSFTLQKKFGNTLTYTKCDTWFLYSTDRLDGSTRLKRHTYWRLTEVEDRYGVRLNYDYSEPGQPNNVSLIPRTITSPDRPNQFLVIARTSDFRRVASITDSRGFTTSFNYDTGNLSYGGVAQLAPRLESVDYADGTTTSYGYSGGRETETDNSNPDEAVITEHFHTNLQSITDKRGNTHTFAYGFNQSNEYWSGNTSGSRTVADTSGLPGEIQECIEDALAEQGSSGEGSWKMMYGQPRRVSSVTLPNNIGTSTFSRQGSTRYGSEVDFLAAPVTTVTDAVGNTTIYEFTDMEAEVVDIDTTPESVSQEWMIYYLTSTIHHGGLAGQSSHLGTESYSYDKAAGFALKTATDISGNTTTWEYEDTRTQPVGIAADSITMSKWADPVAKVDALNRRESYTYGNFRIMANINDVYGTSTAYSIDGLGRRLAKDVTGSADGSISGNNSARLRQENYLYGNNSFEAFQTGMEVVAYSSLSGQPWEVDLVTEYTPDTRGRVWKEALDPDGENLLTEHSYDLNNNRTATTDARGNTTQFSYDELNRLVEVTYPLAETSTGERAAMKQIWYDFNGNKAAEIDEEGNYSIYHYDALNRRIRTIRDMDGLGLPSRNANDLVPDNSRGSVTAADIVTEVVYNAVSSVSHAIDARGTVTRTEYDALRRPIAIYTDDLGAGTAASSPTQTHTELFYETSISLGGVSYQANPGSTAFDTSAFKPTRMVRHDAVQTGSGVESFTTYQVYDSLYRPLIGAAQFTAGNAGSFTATHRLTTSEYGTISAGKESLQNSITDSLGKKTLTVMDGLRRPLTVTDAFGTSLASISRSFYTSTGLVWRNMDPLNRRSETEYDGVGRPVRSWAPDPFTGSVNRSTPANPLLGSPSTETVYDANSNVISTTNPLGNTWTTSYDTRNRKVQELQPAVTDAEDPSATVSSAVPQIDISYDGVGNVISSTDARGHTSRTVYDRAYRPQFSLSNPSTGSPSADPSSLGIDDILTESVFDKNSNVTALIDGNGNITRNAYDALNRLIISATDPTDGDPADPNSAGYTTGDASDLIVRNEYDDSGNLTQVTDAADQQTAFRYDGLARKTHTIWDVGSPVARTELSSFGAILQTSRTDPNGQTTNYFYDDLHRLEEARYPSRSQDDRIYSYDLVGNMLSVTYPNETPANQLTRQCSQTYDHLNRAIAEISAGRTHSYGYDKAGNRRTTTYGSTGRHLDCAYDVLNRLTSCTELASPSASTASGKVSSYQYALNGNITRKTLPNGNYTDCSYDALNRKLSKDTFNSTGASIISFDYSQPIGTYPSSYDNLGSVLSVSETYGDPNIENRTVSNIYDQAYRLDQETLSTSSETTVTDYGYSKANNRISKTVTTNGSQTENQSYTYGDTTDSYNTNQLKSVTSGSDVTTFTYDANGNRIGKALNGSTTQTLSYDVDNRLVAVDDSAKGDFAYLYDHRTRRVLRGESSASGQSTQISFSGGTSAQEIESGSTTVEYIRGSDYGGGIGGVLYTIRGGSRSYNAYNSRGDVVSQTNDSQAITWQAAYEAFGTRTDEEGTNNERQKANTKDEDPTGLLNEGMRYRDLEFGVFMTRDPAGFVDGPNVYTYVRQNPWSSFDPYGLWETGSYWGDVGSFYKGMGKSVVNAAIGAAEQSGPKQVYNLVTGKTFRDTKASFNESKKFVADPSGYSKNAANTAIADVKDKLSSPEGVGELFGYATQAVIAKKVGGTSARGVKKGQVGTRRSLKSKELKGDGLDIHEAPSQAAVKQALTNKLNRPPTSAELKIATDQLPAVAIPTPVHAKTRTFFNKNTRKQVNSDASNLDAASKADAISLSEAGQKKAAKKMEKMWKKSDLRKELSE